MSFRVENSCARHPVIIITPKSKNGTTSGWAVSCAVIAPSGKTTQMFEEPQLDMVYSKLALVYSVAEYCAPVWTRSALVLSDIRPPDVRRKMTPSVVLDQIENKTSMPVHNDVFHRPNKRLKSRRPIRDEGVDREILQGLRKKQWEESGVKNSSLIVDPNTKSPGFELPRPIWTTLNRIRTDWGKCDYPLHKWGFSETPERNSETHCTRVPSNQIWRRGWKHS